MINFAGIKVLKNVGRYGEKQLILNLSVLWPKKESNMQLRGKTWYYTSGWESWIEDVENIS